MVRTRIIPCLLLSQGGLVKTIRFRQPKYVGDPINAIRIFNDKEVDELVILDIDASKSGGKPDFELLARINKEAFMPLGYGGGISTLDEIKRILNLGYEKIILNTAALRDPGFVTKAAEICGSQSVVVSMDVKRNFLGAYRVYNHAEKRPDGRDPVVYARDLERLGAGEIVLNSVDRDGTMTGFDEKLIRLVSHAVSVPVIALGGAGRLDDFRNAVQSGASAVSAGSFFVFHGPHRAVLITYPERDQIDALFQSAGRRT